GNVQMGVCLLEVGAGVRAGAASDLTDQLRDLKFQVGRRRIDAPLVDRRVLVERFICDELVNKVIDHDGDPFETAQTFEQRLLGICGIRDRRARAEQKQADGGQGKYGMSYPVSVRLLAMVPRQRMAGMQMVTIARIDSDGAVFGFDLL